MNSLLEDLLPSYLDNVFETNYMLVYNYFLSFGVFSSGCFFCFFGVLLFLSHFFMFRFVW